MHDSTQVDQRSLNRLPSMNRTIGSGGIKGVSLNASGPYTYTLSLNMEQVLFPLTCS